MYADSRSKHTSVLSNIPISRYMNPWKTQRDADWESWVGQAEESILQVCKLTELKQTKEWERYQTRFRYLYETLLVPGNMGIKLLSRMASRQNGFRDQASHSRKSLNTKSRSVHRWLSHQRPIRVGGASLSSRELPSSVKTVQSIRSTSGLTKKVPSAGFMPPSSQTQWACYKKRNVGWEARFRVQVWKSRWPSWAFRPNEPYGFCGRKATLNRASALVTVLSTDIRGHEALLQNANY